MADRYALVDADGLVVNLVLWDGVAEWSPPEGLESVAADDGVDLGWRFQDSVWIEPAEQA